MRSNTSPVRSGPLEITLQAANVPAMPIMSSALALRTEPKPRRVEPIDVYPLDTDVLPGGRHSRQAEARDDSLAQ
jgi:hypothetical protein